MGNPRIPGDESQPTIPGERAQTNQPTNHPTNQPSNQPTNQRAIHVQLSFNAHARIYDEE
eukprot:3707343-Prymnesium_polylepis.1